MWSGEPNSDLLDVQCLTAIMETDWMPYPFFGSLRCMKPGSVKIPAGSIVAHLTPIQIGPVVEGTLVIQDEPDDLREVREDWSARRVARQKVLDKNPETPPLTKQYISKCRHSRIHMPEPAYSCEEDVEEVGFVEELRRHGLFVFENFLTPGECSEMINSFEVDPEHNDTEESDWYNRCSYPVWSDEVKDKLIRQGTDLACKLFNHQVYQENPHQAIWRKGNELRGHTDLGADLVEFPERQFSMVCYLNDDYEGGAFTLPSVGAEIRFDAGAMVMFAGGSIVHGVREVTSGERYTALSWFGHPALSADTLEKARKATFTA